MASRSVFGEGRLRFDNTARIEGSGGRLIRHAAAAAFPVVPLPVAVIEPAFRALLVPPGFLPASLAAIPVAPVTMTADPEHHATAGPPANPLTQELFAGPHPRSCGGTGQPRPVLAISVPSADDVGPFFRVGAKNPISTNGRGFPFPPSAHPARVSASLPDDEDSTSHDRRSSKKTQPCSLLSLFPSAALNAAPLLSDGHEKMSAMARKRNGWVPFGEASGSLDGPVKAFHDTSPQARHHFTQADQVNQLVSASEADPDLGFMARLMALCCLPRTNPGNRKEYVRRNGPYKLGMTAGIDNKLPYGNLPRLILAWICTEAVRTQSRVLVLGNSLSKFMRTLGVYNSGGQPQTRLRNQMKRLFGCTVSLVYEDGHGRQFVSSLIAERGELWWDPKRPDERMLWKAKSILVRRFSTRLSATPCRST